jgi:proton glutamate symport protein
MSQPVRILLALIAGLAVGILLSRVGPSAAQTGILVAQPIGTAWLNALQMTVIPLVVSLLITGIASTTEAANAGRLAGRTIGYALIMLAVNATIAAMLTPLILNTVPIPGAAAQALRAALAGVPPVATPPSPGEIFAAIVPSNAFAAAAGGALLSLIVFTLVFAFALTRIDGEGRTLLVRMFAAIRDTMLVVVGWVLWLAPLGVFALAYLVGARAGSAAFGALVHYLAVISTIGVVVTLTAYLSAAIGSRVGIGRFTRASLPAQAFAVSTQSSLATLPTMLKAAGEMGIPSAASGVTLPLYIGRWFGVEVPVAAVALGVLTGVVTSLGSISLPSQLTFFASVAPISSAMGTPLAPLGLLIAVETIPDIFRTLGNVTSNLALTAVATRDQTVPEARAG